MTLGNTVAARMRLIVWCRECGQQVEFEPAEMVRATAGYTGSEVPARSDPDILDPLARVFDAWGFDRCLWGTDWTRAFAVVNYERAVEPFLKTDCLSDTERADADGRRHRQGLRLVAKKG
jgi:hypothetical protein